MKSFILFVLLQIVVVFQVCAEVSVAITIDDLPRHGRLLQGESRLDVAKRFIEAFKKTETLEAYGFVNAEKLEDHPEEIEILKMWKAAGQPLGNHTYSHPNLAKTSASDFIDDIEKNEKILADLEKKEIFKWFRYPFLIEGDTLQKRNAVRSALQKMDYTIAQVTIDFEDWAWNAPYVRCMEKKDEEAVKWLKKSYIEHALNRLDFAQKAAQVLYGRAISHVLLLHIGTFDSLMYEELIQQFKLHHVKFVPLAKAMSDSIYKEDHQKPMNHGYPLLDQVLAKKKLPFPEVAKLPLEELEKLCQ